MVPKEEGSYEFEFSWQLRLDSVNDHNVRTTMGNRPRILWIGNAISQFVHMVVCQQAVKRELATEFKLIRTFLLGVSFSFLLCWWLNLLL